MASIISHPVVPLFMFTILGQSKISVPLLLTGIFISILPDIDIIGFYNGVSYSSQFGHRGYTHSIFFSLIISIIVTFLFNFGNKNKYIVFLFLFISGVSHGFIDSMTTGGLGVEFLWPISQHRYFLPFRIIKVSPIGVHKFLNKNGMSVLKSEFIILWLPLFIVFFLKLFYNLFFKSSRSRLSK